MGGEDIVEGVVRVDAFELEGVEESFEFVDAQAWLDEAGELEGVETNALRQVEAEGAADVVEEDVPVELDVVAHEDAVAAVVEESAEPFGAGEAVALEVDGEHGVVVSADDGRQLALGFDDDIELGARDYLAAAHLDGGNLDDVVGEGVEAGGLGVEEDYLLRVDGEEELLEVGGAVVVEEVGGRDGGGPELAHEVACCGVVGQDAEVVEDAGPGDEAGLVGDDGEVREEELERGGGEDVEAGDFEVGRVAELAADAVGVGVGGNDDGHAAFGVDCGITPCEADGETVFVGAGALAEGAGGAVVRATEAFFVGAGGKVVVAGLEDGPLFGAAAVGIVGVVGDGEELGVDAHLAGGVGVEEVEEVGRGAVVGAEVVDVGGAALFELLEGLHVGADE